MTPTAIRDQVLYNIFGEGTPPASAYNRTAALLKEVMRELEDLGQWWWSRRVVGGIIAQKTTITDSTTKTLAGEFAELTSLVKDQTLLAIENIVTFSAQAITQVDGANIATSSSLGKVLERIPNDSRILALIAARAFDPALASIIAAGAEIRYSLPGDPQYYFFGSDILNVHGSYFSQRVMSYPIPAETTFYSAEISVRTDLEFTTDDDQEQAQYINERIGLALIAGGTARIAAAFGYNDIYNRFMPEYQSQISRMRMDNARMMSNNLMECEYNDI